MNEFSIRIPRERPFSAVAGFVVGGIASRHDLTLDALDDLRLALDSLLEHDEKAAELDGDVAIDLRVTPEAIETSVGPLGTRTAAELQQEAGNELGLRRLLETLVDHIGVREGDGGSWVELHKRYVLAGSEAGG
ncbi:MAG: hypothetical protein H0V68_01840 [Actinobacteria bacterium]|nr:hypothetical protein [Actinomycetota bacterium]